MDEAQTEYARAEGYDATKVAKAEEAIEPPSTLAGTWLDRGILWAGRGVAWVIVVAMAISVYEVIMRYGFNRPTSWAHESTVMLVAALFALGGPAALARDRHIRVRLIYDHVSPGVKRWLDVVNGFIGLLFAGALTYAAVIMFYKSVTSPTGEFRLERSGTSWNPPAPAFVKGMILLAVALMLLQIALHLFRAARGKTGDSGITDIHEGRERGSDAAGKER